MPNEPLPCIVCGKALQSVFQEADGQPYEGLAFTSHGHYGGTVFDPMDGRYLEVNICDACLMAAAKRQHVLVGQDRKMVTLDGAVIGTTPVRRELVPWDPEVEDEFDAVDFGHAEEIFEARELGFVVDTRFTDDELRAISDAKSTS